MGGQVRTRQAEQLPSLFQGFARSPRVPRNSVSATTLRPSAAREHVMTQVPASPSPNRPRLPKPTLSLTSVTGLHFWKRKKSPCGGTVSYPMKAMKCRGKSRAFGSRCPSPGTRAACHLPGTTWAAGVGRKVVPALLAELLSVCARTRECQRLTKHFNARSK